MEYKDGGLSKINFEYGHLFGIYALMSFESDFQRGELDPITEKNIETASFLSVYFKARADSFAILYKKGILETLDKFDDHALVGDLLGSEGKDIPEEFNEASKVLERIIKEEEFRSSTTQAIRTLSPLYQKALDLLKQKQIEIN